MTSPEITIKSTSEKAAVFKQVKAFLGDLNFNIAATNETKPWGGYFALKESDAPVFIRTFFPHLSLKDFEGFSVLSPKILLVAPNKRLSWQYHHRRSEIWKVIGGNTAIVISPNDTETDQQPLKLGSVVNLNKGVRHRLVGLQEWGIIAEIWKHTDPDHPSDEEDIVRVQDDFGR